MNVTPFDGNTKISQNLQKSDFTFIYFTEEYFPYTTY